MYMSNAHMFMGKRGDKRKGKPEMSIHRDMGSMGGKEEEKGEREKKNKGA